MQCQGRRRMSNHRVFIRIDLLDRMLLNMWYLVILQAAIVYATPELQQRRLPLRGTYTQRLYDHEHEIVTPRKVTSKGEHISHNVTHYHDEEGSEVHYRVDIGGSEYHLELIAADDFIAPGMLIERRKRDLHVRHRPKDRPSKCHYRGFVRSQPHSRVALSACDGLSMSTVCPRHTEISGVICVPTGPLPVAPVIPLIRSQTRSSGCLRAGVLYGKDGEFWLEAAATELEEHNQDGRRSGGNGDEKYVRQGATMHTNMASTVMARPHLVFRRSAAAEIDASRKRRRKKKKKYEKNCGTREPRRLTETRLEWQSQSGLVQVQGRGRRKYHQPRRWQRSRRLRRSVSRARHVEALVVADSSMMVFHQDGDVETYLLTIMNIVSSLYLDPTIGNFINVVVVRIILMEEDEVEQGLNITINADKTLYNFCKWQEKLNPADDSHPNHHDVAILVTREDICSRANTPCSTLGVAHVAGMCQPDRSCSVNEDNGITLAHTITHELGHNFGMYHDTEKIGCSKRDGDTLHVMTPTFEVDTVGVAWSRCSRRDITNFLDQGKGECLEDEPVDNDYEYPDLPPGAMYNAEHQCRLQFGVREAMVCSPLQEICSKLWCIVDGSCTTMLHPAASGTHCGKHMWCQNQECVTIADRLDPIDGGWGEWGAWSECSRTCGAGISIIERKCDHPQPAHEGKFCIGERRRYKICNTDACLEGTPSFRSMQCSNYNGKEYKGKNYTWLPYFEQTEPCELYCTDTEESVIVPWGEAALDGTPCNVGTRDMCIAGICRKVGCDWIVNSDASEDRCGVCHGDGTQCETTAGLYEKNEGPGYKEVVVIPSGSRNIKIEEVGNSKNYIGIGVPRSEKYFLNGKRQITLAGEYEVAGTPALYERERDREKVRIPGPIKEDIAVYLIYRGHYRNFGLHYEYTVPKKEQDRAPEYSWVFSDWSLCTVTCGGGTQISQALCHERKSGVVEDTFCFHNDKPEPIIRECNINPCPARWWVGPWQMCPVNCGEGAFRKRSVMCVSSGNGIERSELALPDRDCDEDAKPEELGPCPNLPNCEPVSDIPLIVLTENKDISFYNVTDNDPDGITEEPEILGFDNLVDGNPDASMYNTRAKWLVSKWSNCIDGRRSRTVSCSVLRDCDPESKPTSNEECHGGKWIYSKWGACNATCLVKSGLKRRDVICRDRATNFSSKDCNLERRPLDTRRCHLRRQCTEEKLGCKDSMIPVSICAHYKRMCDVSSNIKKKCCAMCFKRRRQVHHNRQQIYEN